MPELIDKHAAYEAIKHEAETHEFPASREAYERAARIIDQMKPVEEKSVEEKTMRWVYGYCDIQRMQCWYCEKCGNDAYWDTDYGQQLFDFCPHCWQKMQKVKRGQAKCK